MYYNILCLLSSSLVYLEIDNRQCYQQSAECFQSATDVAAFLGALASSGNLNLPYVKAVTSKFWICTHFPVWNAAAGTRAVVLLPSICNALFIQSPYSTLCIPAAFTPSIQYKKTHTQMCRIHRASFQGLYGWTFPLKSFLFCTQTGEQIYLHMSWTEQSMAQSMGKSTGFRHQNG